MLKNAKKLAALFLFLAPLHAYGQSITFTSPLTDLTVKEGDDYATTVLKNPWDFKTRRDIGWEESYTNSSISVANGLWAGTYSGQGGYIFPLFPGFKGTLFAEGLPEDKTLPGFGINHPIKASKYNYLSFRLSQTDRSALAVHWNSNKNNPEYWPIGEQFGVNYDGFFNSDDGHVNSGFVTYTLDMNNVAGTFDQSAGAWSGNVIALRIDPSIVGQAGAKTKLDWVRLVDPASAPELTFTWDTTGLGQKDLVTIWIDTDNAGFNGDPLARFTDGSDPGSFTLKTAALPPGTYYFYLTIHDEEVTTELANSGYSVKLVVSAKPEVTVISPSPVTGKEYSTSEVGNAWNMSSATDVANLNTLKWSDVWRQFTSPKFVDGAFSAIANPPLTEIGNSESDVQVHMNIPDNKLINTSKYRYLTYRMKVDPKNHPTIADKVREGWVSRLVFWNSDVILDAGRSAAHVVYEDWHTYTIDLWDSNTVELGKQWKSFRTIKNFRIDPLEVYIPTEFKIDYVKLSSPNYTTKSKYKIRFKIADSDSSSFTASLYYSSKKNDPSGRKIKTLTGLSKGTYEYNWNTAGLNTSKSYYVYVVVSDGTNKTRADSTATILVDNGKSLNKKQLTTPYDFDGDGKSDYLVYRGSTGTFQLNGSGIGVSSFQFGDNTFTPIQADWDGDLRKDYSIVNSGSGGILNWYNVHSSTLFIDITKWGLQGDQLAPADFNGDGKDDIVAYRNGAWFILYADKSSTLAFWGLAGDVTVPGDYDGDGKGDLAVWRPTDGTWWIFNSGFSTGHALASHTAQQWGMSGDIPMPADYNGDGKTDFAVWRPSTGTWFVLNNSKDKTVTTQQWGVPGDVPLAGDFNGDGKAEFTVYRNSVGTWYTNYGNNTSSAQQWGISGDKISAPRL